MTSQAEFPFMPAGGSLANARAEVKRHREVGIVCPCCDLFVKVYRRPITSSMARWLIGLVRRHAVDPRWFSTHEAWSLAINSGTGDVGKLAYWELAERRGDTIERKTKRTSGLWRPTPRGVDFVYGRLQVPSHAVVYGGSVLALEGEQVGIARCLGNAFDYDKLMRDEL